MVVPMLQKRQPLGRICRRCPTRRATTAAWRTWGHRSQRPWTTRIVKAWDEVDPAFLPEATTHDLPLCANCTLAESFRQRFPERVTDKAPRPGVSLPPQ